MSSSKRPLPFDEPPSPESSSEEEEDEEEEFEEEQQPQQKLQTPSKPPLQSDEEEVEEEEDEDEEEDDDEEEEDDDDETKNPTLTPKTPMGPTKQQLHETDSETDSDDTDAQLSNKAASNYTIKPTPSIPKSSTTSKPLSSKGPKKDRNFDDDEDGTEKKGFITRLWGFNDEIAALQGMIDFRKEFNKDPLTNQDDFYNFVRVKLSNSKFTKLQVIDKVRRMKKKFKNNLGKSSGGKDPEISNPHELKSFQLSKIVWGDEENINVNAVSKENGTSNNHSKKSGASAKKAKVSEKVTRVEADMMEVDGESKQRVVVKDESTEFGRLYPHLMRAFDGESMPKVPLLEGFKGCLSKVESSKLEEWDRKWKEVRVAETNAYVSRLALIQEQTSWFCNSMK